jgi:hypothetical protein
VSEVAVTVQARARVDAATAFDAIAPVDLTRVFPGMGLVPAVVSVRDQVGDWDRAGQTRVAVLADGSEAHEELTAVQRPEHFAYNLRIGGTLGRVVPTAQGAWWFASADRPPGAATDIRWTYTFHPRPGAGVLVRLLLVPLWRRYARRSLALAVAIAEA